MKLAFDILTNLLRVAVIMKNGGGQATSPPSKGCAIFLLGIPSLTLHYHTDGLRPLMGKREGDLGGPFNAIDVLGGGLGSGLLGGGNRKFVKASKEQIWICGFKVQDDWITASYDCKSSQHWIDTVPMKQKRRSTHALSSVIKRHAQPYIEREYVARELKPDK